MYPSALRSFRPTSMPMIVVSGTLASEPVGEIVSRVSRGHAKAVGDTDSWIPLTSDPKDLRSLTRIVFGEELVGACQQRSLIASTRSMIMEGEKLLSMCEMGEKSLTEGSFFHISFDHSAFRSKSSFYSRSARPQPSVSTCESLPSRGSRATSDSLRGIRSGCKVVGQATAKEVEYCSG